MIIQSWSRFQNVSHTNQAATSTVTTTRSHSGRNHSISESFTPPLRCSGACGKTLGLDLVARGGHHPHQLLVAHLRHFERRILLGVLLGLDHEPAFVAVAG